MTDTTTGGATSVPVRPRPAVLSSVAEAVTFFEDRAEVRRSAVVSLRPGTQWVVLAGATPLLDDRSLVAHAEDGVRVVAARVVRRIVLDEAAGDAAETRRLEERLREATRRDDQAGWDVARVRNAAVRVGNLFNRWIDGLKQVPAGTGDETAQAEWRELFTTLEGERSRLRDAAAEAAEHKQSAAEARRDAESRLAAVPTLPSIVECLVEVQLESESAGEARVRFSYRTPCALWRPEHLARLDMTDDPKAASVELVTYATAWQATGEHWDAVRVRFSTARPSRPAQAPLLNDDVLRLRAKTTEERKAIVVEAREQAIETAGLERGAAARAEMPGVDDGGRPLEYEPSETVTIAPDGRPLRVEIGRVRLPAEVAWVLMAEKAAAPHLRATMTLASGGPLLAGPVRLARGAALVGRGLLSFVGSGEPFELGFGADDGVRARRQAHDDRATAAVTGTQRLRRSVTLYLSNLSGSRRELDVVERVPVSEIEDVEVSLVSNSGWKHDARDGFARRRVVLEPRGAEKLELHYEIRAGSKVVMQL